MKIYVRGSVRKPIMRPCLEQIACGMISPKTTIPAVAPIMATVPEVKSSRNIVNVLFTNTFPSKSVQRRKLPRRRTGSNFLAYFFSSSSPEIYNVSKYILETAKYENGVATVS